MYINEAWDILVEQKKLAGGGKRGPGFGFKGSCEEFKQKFWFEASSVNTSSFFHNVDGGLA